MEFNLISTASLLLLVFHFSEGLETKKFQLTMPNVRPYRVSIKSFHMFVNVILICGIFATIW